MAPSDQESLSIQVTGDAGSIPGLGRALEKEMATYSRILENPTGRGIWWATVPGVTKSQTQLSTHY